MCTKGEVFWDILLGRTENGFLVGNSKGKWAEKGSETFFYPTGQRGSRTLFLLRKGLSAIRRRSWFFEGRDKLMCSSVISRSHKWCLKDSVVQWKFLWGVEDFKFKCIQFSFRALSWLCNLSHANIFISILSTFYEFLCPFHLIWKISKSYDWERMNTVQVDENILLPSSFNTDQMNLLTWGHSLEVKGGIQLILY